MALRILGGAFKGLKLDVNEKTTRPTGVMLKRRLFDARQRFDGVHFIDLCAGSGSIGFEALSRGANKLSLIESDFNALRCIKDVVNKIENNKNFESSKSHISVSKKSAERWLSFHLDNDAKKELDLEQIIFFDPPYEDSRLYRKVLDLLLEKGFVGELWVEYDITSQKDLITRIDEIFQLNGVKKYRHGQHEVAMMRFNENMI